MGNIKAIAIHLPQFHPFAENDEWWGRGFTEWTNVARAKPLYKGHYQPHLPSDLGYYDLRLEESRIAQAELAKEYGIYGFCYYHYWFNGKRIMNAPIDGILASGKPDFPFMLCWANETWSRRWLGEEKEVLIKQDYGPEDSYNHAKWLCDKVFIDKRYITIHGRPAFMIYRPHDLPDYKQTIAIFKEVALKAGLPEPFMIASNSHSHNLEGFDQVMNFQPQLSLLKNAFKDHSSLSKFVQNRKLGVNSASLKVYDYSAVKRIMAAVKLNYKFFPCVFVGWDNTARRGKNGIIIANQNKADFKQSLIEAKNIVKDNPADEQIVFINAWNEWAEGNHLEPDHKSGHEYLEAVKEVFNG
ncbi:glycoside hydrolase family 99-like domain-containing protein [Mucilaginibacter terrae]|uniref:glycosyltransferase WbsX family protein n=1 Tax=Mucilaginibacter terrae TaxID=1955052 RepID=UPI0036339E3B